MLGIILTGGRIRLRAPALEDLSTFTRWFADPEVTRYLLRRYPPSPAQEAGWFESMATSEKDLVWSVVLEDGEPVIGVIGLHRIDWPHRHAWIEIVLGERSAWGKGYATEAMRLATGHAFHELGLEKVLASVYRGNERSIRMAETLGYRQCGLLRRNAFFAGEWHDEWLGEILRQDWSAASVPAPSDPGYDFNLLVSRARGGYRRAHREIRTILKALGDERPTVSRTPVRGIIGVKTSLAPRDVVRELWALHGRNPLVVQYTCKWLPVDGWGPSDVDAMKDAVRGLRGRIEPTESWRMTLEKHGSSRHHQLELIRILAEPIAAKVDLVHPDKILRVDILGPRAGISVLAPDDVFSVAGPPGSR